MTRQQKYPDTKYFHFHNQNPHNRITTDCVIRAISKATDIPYNQVVMELAEFQCKTGFDPSEKDTFGKYLESKGWKKFKQPRKYDGSKFTGKEFCYALGYYGIDELGYDDFQTLRIVANIGGHHAVAIIDHQVWDTWDSTDGCIGNFWAKPAFTRES